MFPYNSLGITIFHAVIRIKYHPPTLYFNFAKQIPYSSYVGASWRKNLYIFSSEIPSLITVLMADITLWLILWSRQRVQWVPAKENLSFETGYR
jgi:hypothetical protein